MRCMRQTQAMPASRTLPPFTLEQCLAVFALLMYSGALLIDLCPPPESDAAFAAVRYTLDSPALTYALLLAFVFLANIGESFVFVPNKLPWILLILCTIRVTERAQAHADGIQHASA